MDLDAYDLAADNKSVNAFLLAAAKMSDAEKKNAPSRVSDETLVALSLYACVAVRAAAAQLVLVIGCLIHLYFLATADTARRGLRKAFFRKLGISPSQCYRCEDVWKRFGPRLLEEPRLRRAFKSAEPLKLLSASSVPEEARDEAIEMARQGEEISIKSAQALIRKHLPNSGAADSVSSDHGPLSKSIWCFAGDALQIRVKLNANAAIPNKEVLMREFESAISALLKELPSDNSGGPQNAA